jgi:hypothetical protein
MRKTFWWFWSSRLELENGPNAWGYFHERGLLEMVIAQNASKSPAARTKLWKISIVFVFSTIIFAFLEMLFWKIDVIIAIGILALIYFLGSLRFVPWKTSIKRAFSIGVLFGLFLGSFVALKFGVLF